MINLKNKKMSISPIRFKLKKEKYKDKSSSNSNSSLSLNDSNNESSNFENNNFNQNFFNDSDNNGNNIDDLDIDNKEFNTNTNTKYSSNINPKDSIIKPKKEKKDDKNNISRNSLYESKDISNIIEENNNNSFYKFSFLKFFNNQFLFNNNSSNNNNNATINNNSNSNLLTNIHNFIIEKLSKPITNWIIKSNTIKILRKIGEGNSSDIFLGIYRGIEIAEKRLHLNNKDKNITEFKREVSSFISLSHPYLLMFFGVIAEPKHLSIITEYCPGGNLHELLYKKKHIYLSWKIRKEFLLQIAIGMNYLHTNNPPILHRDLKSLNILLTNEIKNSTDITDIKIADLGLSVVNEKKNLSNERIGTCHWMAPEVIVCQRYTTKSDVYSFGIIIWEVCTREMPYDNINKETILYRVSVNRERPSKKRIPNDTPVKLKELMERCLEHEPNKRPSFENIINIIKKIDT